MTEKSERYYVQKITRELLNIWQNLSIDEEQVAANETLNLKILKEVLSKMGFVDLN